ncbi:MAG: phosphopantothenoylcysteine decarboxylase [Candidatus Omnitrophica bacterium]|nr:phosphopantothenoylcysteine decarboxylase [Candidatus Omnitrophota bacterium]
MKFSGKHRPAILITAGPTREKIDPVRFISNYSTGTFGYALAAEAQKRGMRVVLVSGPTHLDSPKNVRLIKIESALEMRKAVLENLKKSDYVIMSAAVSDWRAKKISLRKIKKSSGTARLELIENPDILSEICARKGERIIAGFVLETEDLERNAIKKLLSKNADLIVANCLKRATTTVFGDDNINIIIIDKLGNRTIVRNRPKRELAKIILDKVLNFNI